MRCRDRCFVSVDCNIARRRHTRTTLAPRVRAFVGRNSVKSFRLQIQKYLKKFTPLITVSASEDTKGEQHLVAVDARSWEAIWLTACDDELGVFRGLFAPRAEPKSTRHSPGIGRELNQPATKQNLFWRQYEEAFPQPSRDLRDGNDLPVPEYCCVRAISHLNPRYGDRSNPGSHSRSDSHNQRSPDQRSPHQH